MANIKKYENDDNKYRFTVSLGKDAQGNYKRATKVFYVEGKYTPKQKEEYILNEYMKFKKEVLSGEYIAPSNMIFSDFAKEWENKFALSELSQTAISNHRLKLKNHILPVIGHMHMDKINQLMLLNLMQNLTRKDGQEGELTYHSKQDIYRTLQSVFKYATEWKVIEKNPMHGIKKPKPPKDAVKEKLQVYNEDEIAQLLQLVQSEPSHWRLLFTLAVTAGLRRGELLGLEWKHVDFDNQQILIEQTIVLTGSGPLIKGTKSDSSERVVSLPGSMMKELKEYHLQWRKDKLRLADKWTEKEREWIFCNEHGQHLYPSSPSNWWSKFVKKHEFRYIRLHDLRHTSASLLIAQGVHAKIISERLGHSDISITMNTYGHALKSADRAAADKFEMLFSKSNSN
ncbi:tyrosine-type recombinase/integrase [Lysinibacillus boronitolerans]|uniref:tyrosine-type recombinase/integrase n=1 Tax=Lysinibacillus boronitolerans TaxID=309788 RepID=UPI0028995633|nr:site-specific integrase [Lysinibacillus boronitolerans]